MSLNPNPAGPPDTSPHQPTGFAPERAILAELTRRVEDIERSIMALKERQANRPPADA